jgi:AraC family transcriptional regulator of arabinose operon
MYMNTGYLNHSHMDFKDKSRPLVVGSCGTYRLSSHPKLPTYRPRGRLDYQIIYITAGCGHFHFDNVDNETIVPAGTDRRNFRNMNIMEKIRQKYTGFILQATM